MRVNAAVLVRRDGGRAVGPRLGLRLGRSNGPNYFLFDVHAQDLDFPGHSRISGFGAGLAICLRLRDRTLIRIGRNWGKAYRR